MAVAVKVRRPRYYPHHGLYAYTLKGFDRKVVPRLRRMRLRDKDIDCVRRIYFYHPSLVKHFDAEGYYRNVAACHLHALSRRQGNDRKMPLLLLLLRTRLFYVGFDPTDGQVAWVWSPAARRVFPTIF